MPERLEILYPQKIGRLFSPWYEHTYKRKVLLHELKDQKREVHVMADQDMEK